MSKAPGVERVIENIALAPPRSAPEFAFFITELAGFGPAADLVVALRRCRPVDGLTSDFDTGRELQSLARGTLNRLGNHRFDVDRLAADCLGGSNGDDEVPRWNPVEAGSPGDPSGYGSLRAFLVAVADYFDGHGRPQAADSLRDILSQPLLPTEWMAESVLLLRAELATPLSPGVRPELERAVSAIRQGFLRVGQRTNF